MEIFQYMFKKYFSLFVFTIISLMPSLHAMKSIDTDGSWKEFTIDEEFYFESLQKKACTCDATLDFSPNADYLYSMVSSLDEKQRIFCLWKLGEKKPYIMTKACSWNDWKDPYNFHFSPNGKFLAAKSVDECWCIYSLASGKLIKTVETKNVKPIFISNDLFFIKSKKEPYRVFLMKNDTCIKNGDFTNITQCDPLNKYVFLKNKIENAHIYDYKRGIILPHKALYATVDDENKKIRIFDNDNLVLKIGVERELECGLESTTDIKFSPKGSFVAIRLDDHFLCIYNLKTNKLSMTAEDVSFFDFNPCDNVIRIKFFDDYSNLRGHTYRYEASKNLYANKYENFQDQPMFKKEKCDIRIQFNKGI